MWFLLLVLYSVRVKEIHLHTWLAELLSSLNLVSCDDCQMARATWNRWRFVIEIAEQQLTVWKSYDGSDFGLTLPSQYCRGVAGRGVQGSGPPPPPQGRSGGPLRFVQIRWENLWGYLGVPSAFEFSAPAAPRLSGPSQPQKPSYAPASLQKKIWGSY
jgi:hypothetical protein